MEMNKYETIEDIRYDLVSFINLMDPYSKKATKLIDHIYDLSIDKIKECVHDFNVPDSFIEYRIWAYEVLENIIEYMEDESYV